MKNRSISIVLIAIAAIFAIGGTAVAASQITASQLATGSVGHRAIRDGGVRQSDLTSKERDLLNAPIPSAVYRIAHYNNGGGGRATVACGDTEAKSQQYVAIAGGAQSESVNGGTTDTQPITSSFPGRMNWDTNTPKANRLDGWIVNFGSGAAPSAGSGTLEIWALCVKTNDIPTQITHY